MALDDSQLITLKADIDANSGGGGEFENVPSDADGDTTISEAYNLEASPVSWGFGVAVPYDTLKLGIDYDEFIALTQGERAGWATLTGGFQPFDAGELANRVALVAIFPPTAPNTRDGLLDAISRTVLRGEKLYTVNATGPGGGDGSGQLTAQIIVLSGDITRNDVSLARALS